MAYFQTKNTDLGKFWRVLQWKVLHITCPLGPFYGYLVYFVATWYILWLFGISFSRFGMLYLEKSGNTG
jgi:hypothetical protein